jgi:hypothetical protein
MPGRDGGEGSALDEAASIHCSPYAVLLWMLLQDWLAA